MTDQTIALILFGLLLVLSLLPISTIQTRILFNQAFTEIIEKKIHRQNMLSELYTPGFFHTIDYVVPKKDEAGTENQNSRLTISQPTSTCSSTKSLEADGKLPVTPQFSHTHRVFGKRYRAKMAMPAQG